MTVNVIVYGLQCLRLEPNPEDALNLEAAHDLQTNRGLFEEKVRLTMRENEFK